MRLGVKRRKRMVRRKMRVSVGVGCADGAEHVVSLIYSLLLALSGERRARVICKFVENDNEKVDRLIELRQKYRQRVAAKDESIELQERCERRGGVRLTFGVRDDGEELDEEDKYLECDGGGGWCSERRRRCEAGLFTLQQIDMTLLLLFETEEDTVCTRGGGGGSHAVRSGRGSSSCLTSIRWPLKRLPLSFKVLACLA
jgi:hypothetical protein